MNNKFKLGLLLAIVALVLAPGASAFGTYVTPLNTLYGPGLSCGTCHVDPNNGGQRNTYGTLFENQTNHATNPTEALTAIGSPNPDDIPPVTLVSGVTENGSFNNSVTVSLNATDNPEGSGVNETLYMVNGGPTTTYSAPFVVDIIGQDNVTYWSTDKAGNVEPQNMVNFTIENITIVDIIAPVTLVSGVTENGSFNNSVTVSLNATDNPEGSGVNETLYMVNGGPTTTYSAPFVVDIIGQDNVTYWSTDKAGNVEPQNMVNFTIENITIVDIIAPVTLISGVTENGSFNNSVTVTLNATDNPEGSGVNETLYTVNGGPTTTYSAPFVVDIIGQDNVTYWSTDKAGNVEPQNMVNFTIETISIVDIIPPVTTISDVTENGLFNNNVTVTLNATDNPEGSGVNEILYIVNSGPTTTYSAPFVVDIVGQDNVTYWSTDKAGNVEPQNMVNFTIVTIPDVNPSATREIKPKSILPGESTNITVSISGIANASALQEIVPEGWNVTRGTDSADAFKNSTNEWIWKNVETDKTVTYTLTAPKNISIGTYQINGTIIDANGKLVNVEGDNIVKIDILEFYRRLGNDPGVVETTDLLRAFDDFRNNIVPQEFNRPLSAEEIDELVNEWIIS